MLVAALLAVLTHDPVSAAGEAPRSVAFFGVTLLNQSPAETTEEEMRRVEVLEARLREGMEASGRYVFIDTAPVASEVARHANMADCSGCDARLAAELGADLAVTGVVQKTSNLILSVGVYIRDAATGQLVGGGAADMRGNTDETWERAIGYILRNRILKE